MNVDRLRWVPVGDEMGMQQIHRPTLLAGGAAAIAVERGARLLEEFDCRLQQDRIGGVGHRHGGRRGLLHQGCGGLDGGHAVLDRRQQGLTELRSVTQQLVELATAALLADVPLRFADGDGQRRRGAGAAVLGACRCTHAFQRQIEFERQDARFTGIGRAQREADLSLRSIGPHAGGHNPSQTVGAVAILCEAGGFRGQRWIPEVDTRPTKKAP